MKPYFKVLLTKKYSAATVEDQKKKFTWIQSQWVLIPSTAHNFILIINNIVILSVLISAKTADRFDNKWADL